MVKKIAAVSCGVLLGIVIAFARAGAFPFWSSQQQQPKPPQQVVTLGTHISARKRRTDSRLLARATASERAHGPTRKASLSQRISQSCTVKII